MNPTLKHLKALRLKNNLTIASMAASLGISKTMYLYIESGKRRLSYDMAKNIAKIFKTTPDALFIEDTREYLNSYDI